MARVLKAGMNTETQLSINESVQGTVRGIIAGVRARGDAALRELSQQFDGWSPPVFRLNAEQIEQVDPPRERLRTGVERVRGRRRYARENPSCPGARISASLRELRTRNQVFRSLC